MFISGKPFGFSLLNFFLGTTNPNSLRTNYYYKYCQMAVTTELGLCRFQQFPLHQRMVNGVAINTPHVAFQVLCVKGFGMFFSEFVTAQAASGSFFPRKAGETNDLGWVSRLGMLFAWTVTGLTTLPLRPLTLSHPRLPMRPALKTCSFIFMAAFTDIRPDILRWINLMKFLVLWGKIF